MNNKVLFVSHKKSQCGVYEFGKNICDALQNSKRYEFIRVECSSLEDLKEAISENNPGCIIYNHQPSVFPWLVTRIAPKIRVNNTALIPIPQIGIIHEITQEIADTASDYKNYFLINASTKLRNSLFDYYIAPDPTLLLYNPIVYKTGRLIPSYENKFPLPDVPTIGSFGFGYAGKGFEKIVDLVQREFDEAIIRFNIPYSDFEDKDGSYAKAIARNCMGLITKPGIKLIITHLFLEREEILDFLAQNTINVFLYENIPGRGVSSVIDLAMAVKRPVAVSDSVMFRHVHELKPSICVSKTSLNEIIQNGFSPLINLYNDWNSTVLIWEYERILDNVFRKDHKMNSSEIGIIRNLKSKMRRFLLKPDSNYNWLRSSSILSEDDMSVNDSVVYEPVQIPTGHSFNRILDNEARELYEPTINFLKEIVPITISKKIPEANVQQGFIFDTVSRFLSNYDDPKLLCVGCYEDTASMSLIKTGKRVEEIDPVKNYSIQEYFTKPTTIKGSYDIIFSTSVIEHDPDDETFMRCISDLLAPGGVAILTCDFKEGWIKTDPMPECNYRFYTKDDFFERLLPVMKDCSLIDEPQWNCPDPDFCLGGKFQYTFATLVVRKHQPGHR